jgi:hypothetical protein
VDLLTFVEAVILILKHATFLLLSIQPWESALVHADQHYSEANIDLKIQEHLAAPQEHSVEELASFIMATDIGWLILASVKLISHQVCAEYDQGEFLAELRAESPAESPSPHQDILGPPPSQSPVETQVPTLVPVHRKGPWFKRVWEPLRKTIRKNK